jgi:hypothetical protein
MERIDLQFTVRGVSYYAIIRVKETINGKDYLIQVVSDSEAKPISFDFPVIRESGGYLHVDQEKSEIKLKIASTLSGRLNKPCFVGDKYLLKPDEGSQGWMNFHPIARQRAQLP